MNPFVDSKGDLNIPRIIAAAVAAVILFCLTYASVQTVPAGHVAVGTLFGKVQDGTLSEGLHFTNPLLHWRLFDGRQKTEDQRGVPVPSQDQLSSNIDWSIQYRCNTAMAASMLQETGTCEEVVAIHLIPNFRSIVRERSKDVKKAEDWFTESVQAGIQANVFQDVSEVLTGKGITVTAVLIRNIQLPPVVVKAVESKKERDQKAEEQEAELRRFETEQEQIVKTANAKKKAAEVDAESILILAEAQATANQKIARTLTKELVESQRIEKWDGKLPAAMGGAVPFMKIGGE